MNVLSKRKPEIAGWGVDTDPQQRPGVPREKNNESVTDVRGIDEYELIPRQVPRIEILLSTEHKKLTPIFGTSCPPHGLSGVFRRIAFKRSEGDKLHWTTLLLADRVDVLESALYNLVHLRFNNPFKDRGLSSEFRHGGLVSVLGGQRADTKRRAQEALLVICVLGTGVLFVRLWRRNH